jgi:hypothetical protein
LLVGIVVLGDAMASVFAIGPKVSVFSPEGDGFLRAIKNPQNAFLRREVQYTDQEMIPARNARNVVTPRK